MDKNFARLVDTLAVLQRSRRLTTTEVRSRLEARGHDVTARTVQRDLEQLAATYPLECDQRSRPFAWGWRGDAGQVALPSMDWPEAVSFHLLATYMEGLLPSIVQDGIAKYVAEARRRLAEHFDQLPLRRWPERVRVIPSGQAFLPPKVSRSVHSAVSEAVLLGRRLRIRYRRFDRPTAKPYVVSPLGLVQYGNVFYVPVRFDGHQDVRTLPLHRISRAELLEEPSGIEDFDLSAWIEQGAMGFGGGELIELVLLLKEGMGGLLRESPLSKDQEIVVVGPGLDRCKAIVRDTAQLRRWILSFGSRVTVEAPSGLVEAIGQEWLAASELYGTRNPEQTAPTMKLQRFRSQVLPPR